MNSGWNITTVFQGYTAFLYFLTEMLPRDPLVQTGTTLELNCTILSKYNGTHTASDITFHVGNETYGVTHPYVTVLEESKMSTLRLPNVTRDISGTRAQCYIPDVEHRLGEQYVRVAGKTFYHPPTKLREGNIFSRVCLSFCPQGSPHTGPRPWPWPPAITTPYRDFPWPCPPPPLQYTVTPHPDIFEVVYYVACTLGKQALDIRLKYLLV